jgi:hypothetical protein
MQTVMLIGAWLLLIFVIGAFILVIASTSVQALWMVPFVPTPRPIIDAMMKLADLRPGDTVLELGAGDGRVLFAAEKIQPDIHPIGYEGAPGVWLLAQFRIWLRRSRAKIFCRNFMHCDLSKADVIFTYLSIASMRKLRPKFERELKDGVRIVTHAFSLPEIVPNHKEFVAMPFGGGSNVLRYIWKRPVTM